MAAVDVDVAATRACGLDAVALLLVLQRLVRLVSRREGGFAVAGRCGRIAAGEGVGGHHAAPGPSGLSQNGMKAGM